MKSCKIVASWVLMIIGILSLLIITGGAIDGVLSACRWILDNTIGWWGIPACVVILVMCALLFFAINPMRKGGKE